MSAIELIQKVAALSQQERAQFEELFGAMKASHPASGQANQPEWPDFGQRLRAIYGERTAPDSQIIMEEGRGDR